MTFYVCENDFMFPDPHDPIKSLAEVDCRIIVDPRGWDTRHVRLRRDLETGNFEAFEYFFRTKEKRVVMKSRNLHEVLHFINIHCGDDLRVCRHEEPEISLDCSLRQKHERERERTLVSPDNRRILTGRDKEVI